MELFETEIVNISPDGIVSDDLYFETEEISLINNDLGGGDAESNTPAESLPAIITDNENETVPSTTQDEALPGEETVVSDPGGVSEGNKVEENLENIYKLLSERLPESESESESETQTESITAQSETEITLADIKSSLDSIAELESEQNLQIGNIETALVAVGNNYITYSDFILSGIMAIWGSFIIYLFFRKIG